MDPGNKKTVSFPDKFEFPGPDSEFCRQVPESKAGQGGEGVSSKELTRKNGPTSSAASTIFEICSACGSQPAICTLSKDRSGRKFKIGWNLAATGGSARCEGFLGKALGRQRGGKKERKRKPAVTLSDMWHPPLGFPGGGIRKARKGMRD